MGKWMPVNEIKCACGKCSKSLQAEYNHGLSSDTLTYTRSDGTHEMMYLQKEEAICRLVPDEAAQGVPSGMREAENRDALIAEGKRLYAEIADEHFGYSRNTHHIQDSKGVITSKGIPWMEMEAVCIALALFAKKRVAGVPVEVVEAIVYLLGDSWTPTNPMWGMADDEEKKRIFAIHAWLTQQQKGSHDE